MGYPEPYVRDFAGGAGGRTRGEDIFRAFSSRSIVSGDVRGATLAKIEGAKTSEDSEGPTEVDGDGTR